MPVFLVLLFGFVELSTVVVLEERLSAASVGGPRSSQGGSVSDIDIAVNNSLGPGTLKTMW